MATENKFGPEAREQMIAGVDIIADTGTVKLGPPGRNVVLSKSCGAPRTTHDHVSVAKEITLDAQ